MQTTVSAIFAIGLALNNSFKKINKSVMFVSGAVSNQASAKYGKDAYLCRLVC